MADFSIHPQTSLGAVALTVSDLGRSLTFYRERLGFKVHGQEHGTARLGAGGEDLVVLAERPGARPVSGVTGLYHFAILMPSRRELAAALRRLGETRTPLQGFADHGVSEAIYLADPDGNGIELYRDRPRAEWPYRNGQLQMTTDPLDTEGLLGELAGPQTSWPGLAPGTVLGHVHLHVAHLAEAEAFYRDLLGFELIQRYGAMAAFLSAGGYHHHIGINTWAGAGAPPPPPDAVGLRWFVIFLPSREALEPLLARVEAAGLQTEPRPEGLLLHDPAGNGLILAAR